MPNSSASKKFILVGNKLDLLDADNAINKLQNIEALFISAKEHTHVNILKKELVDKVKGMFTDQPVLKTYDAQEIPRKK